MSVYAELRHAKTREEYEDAMRDIMWEARRDEYLDRLAEEDREEDDDEDREGET